MKCDNCLNARRIISENGLHSICCLSEKNAMECPGVVRLYGTDCHDSLEISDDGKYLTYYNLQCGEGSKYGSYSFVTDDKGTLPSNDEDLIKHGAEAYFNIGGFNDTTDVLDNLRAEIESYEADCILADDSKECKECDKIVFGSIYRIIDRYRNEVSE